MVDLSKYGYRSAASFLRDRSLPMSAFEAVAADMDWDKAKRVLLHKDCPISIRDRFANDPVWWKRFTAFYAAAAPKGYSLNALKDSDRRVRMPHLKSIHAGFSWFLTKLEVL